MNRYSLIEQLTCFCVLLLSCTSSTGQDWPISRGPANEPEPYKFSRQHLQAAPADFLEDASACLLYYGVTHRVDAEGSVETTVHEVTRLNSRKSIEELGEYRDMSYDPSYQKFILNDARVIKPGGQTIEVQPRHLKIRDVGTDYATYHPKKVVVISFPNLEVGDIYEVKWTTRGKDKEFGKHYFTRYSFGSTYYPVLRERLEIHLPKSRPLKYAAINGQVPVKVTNVGDKTVYRWLMKSKPALPRDSDLPSREELRLQVMCSTFPNWQAVADWKSTLRKDCWKCTPKIREQVKTITRQCKTPEDKARALTYWIRKRVRYVSVMASAGRYTPNEPEQVLTNAFGDCKDQAQLLAVMLREVGIETYLVSLGVRGDGQIIEAVPSPWSTHALLLARINGKDHWIDMTSTFAGWDFLPFSDRDRVAYVTDAEGHIKIMRTPPLLPEENRQEITTIVTVRPDGSTDQQRSAKYFGTKAIDQREAWIEVPPGERRRKMTALLQDSHSRSKLHSLAIAKQPLGTYHQPVQAVIDFRIPQHFSGSKALEADFTDGIVWDNILAYRLDYDRKVAMDLWSPFASVHRYVVNLPPAYRLTTNAWQETVTSKWGTFKVQLKRDAKNDRRAEIVFETRLSNTRVHPKDFDAFRKFREAVSDNWRVWLTMTPTRDLRDATALEASLAMCPWDIDSAKILTELYLHNNNRTKARLVVDRIRSLFPDNKELWELTVRSTNTWAQEVSVYRDMLERFPKEKEYVVRLGRALINADKFSEAEKVLQPLTGAESVSLKAKAWYHLGRSAFYAKQYPQALKCFANARKANPTIVESVGGWRFIGETHEQLQQFDDAIRAFTEAAKLDPKNRPVLRTLVKLELAAGRKKSALDWLRRYTILAQGDLVELNRAARFHLHMGRLEDAFDLAMRARELDFHADTQELLGSIYFEKKNFTRAAFHLDRAHHTVAVLTKMIHCHIRNGNVRPALLAAQEATTLPELDPSVLPLVQSVLPLGKRKLDILKTVTLPKEKKGDKVLAAKWSRAIDGYLCADFLRRKGTDSDSVKTLLQPCFDEQIRMGQAYALRGLMQLESGSVRLALADANTAVKMCPNDAVTYFVRGRIGYERADKSALTDLTKAAKLSHHRDAEVLHWLAKAQSDVGMIEEALKTQRSAVQLSPDNKVFAEQLAILEKGKS